MNEERPELSFVVPLFNTGAGLPTLLAAFRSLQLPESWEVVLVDDGSVDETVSAVQKLWSELPTQVTLVELARNYGEHAAVLEGYRHARGEFVVNLDDDLQNPVEEAVRLLRHLRDGSAEVVYARFVEKRHSWLRNAGSRAVNWLATLLMDKPRDLYLSSFRALRRGLVQRIVRHTGPFPYIDGLILQATQRIAQLEVRHEARAHGESGYTWRKLIRLVMNVCFDFSLMPLRVAGVLGLAMCAVGLLVIGEVVLETLFIARKQPGWASLMGVLVTFAGAQLVTLGVIGEYVGRTFLTVSGRPQSVVRTVTIHSPHEP
jgi:undecaprenyl-phosphate 4-deoxy-4-formamido-L-arabinose transferase